MIENKFEERQVTQRVLVDHTYVCDVCGRKMKIPQHYWMVSITKVDKNDNWDQDRPLDCCSKECVNEIYNEFFRNCQNELDNNDFIEVTHQCTYSSVTIKKHRLEEILQEVYEAGVEDGKKDIVTWTSTPRTSGTSGAPVPLNVPPIVKEVPNTFSNPYTQTCTALDDVNMIEQNRSIKK